VSQTPVITHYMSWFAGKSMCSAYKTSDGTKLWTAFGNNAQYSKDSKMVYLSNATNIVALKAIDGTPVWTKLKQAYHSFSSAIVSPNGSLLYYGAEGAVIAVNPTDGTSVWENDFGGESQYWYWFYSPVALAKDGTSLYGFCNGAWQVFSLRTSDGTTNWNVKLTGEVENAVLSPDRGMLYVAAKPCNGCNLRSNIIALNPTTGEKMWQFGPIPVSQIVVSPVNTAVYVRSSTLYAFTATCLNVVAGEYCQDNVYVVKCPAGRFGSLPGQASLSSGCPGLCPRGTYGTVPGKTSEMAACQPCKAGQYQDRVGLTKCEQCLAGKASTSVAATSASACQNCTSGTVASEAGTTSCTSCTAGKYAAGSGLTRCTQCTPGRASASIGAKKASECKNCVPGKSVSEAGASSCKSCVAGQYAPGTGLTQCKQCAAGKVSKLDGASECQDCIPGKVASETGGKVCTTCVKGQYAAGAGLTQCKQCTAGKVSSSDGASACQDCLPGKVASGAGHVACTSCSANTYAPHEGLSGCVPCPSGEVSPPDASQCFDIANMLKMTQQLSETQGGIIRLVGQSNAKAQEVRKKANGAVAKLYLDWATQDVINEAQAIRDQLAMEPAYNVKHQCAQEKKVPATIRSAYKVPMADEVDATYCLNQNRNMLIGSFCNFRPRFVTMMNRFYQYTGSSTTVSGRGLWPNICCKKDNFENLKTCDDPSGQVKRSAIVPFALSQGGNLTTANLYGEIVDVLKLDGYLQTGMTTAIQALSGSDKIINGLKTMFTTTYLCGPRTFDMPNDATNSGIQLCELFYPYAHMLDGYFDSVQTMLTFLERRRRRRRLQSWPATWVEEAQHWARTMGALVFGQGNDKKEIDALHREVEAAKHDAAIEQAKLSRQIVNLTAQVVNVQHNVRKEVRFDHDAFSDLLSQNKQRLRRLDSPVSPFCPAITKALYPDPSTWQNLVNTYCPGYSDVGLMDDNLVILALVYADDVSPEQVPMLQDQGRYSVVDDCPTRTFSAADISLQVVDDENLFVISLDSTSPNGYIRKELPECGNWNTPSAFPRIPQDTISVKVYRDGGGCCPGTKDYGVCQANGCSAEPTPVKDKATNLQFEYDTKVTGEVFTVSYGHKRRRRRALLQGLQGNCGERL
jgi:hypothetical protein